jgi:glycosyltransferase involved in cell wall biosynthesis
VEGRVAGREGIRSHSVREILSDIDQEGGVVRCLRLAEQLAARSRRRLDASDVHLLIASTASDDPIRAISAIHALGAVAEAQSTTALAALLEGGAPWRQEHAAWALGGHPAQPATTRRLLDLVVGGGFSGMLAQRTLEQQVRTPQGGLDAVLDPVLPGTSDPAARRRLVETLGLDPRRSVTGALIRIASDSDEHHDVRTAAIAALGDRRGGRVRAALEGFVRDGRFATPALLALVDAARTTPARESGAKLRVAQLFLHADLDPRLMNLGAGDTGGIASLLVLLADSLGRRPDVDLVLTLSRGQASDALTEALWPRDDRSVFATVPFPSVEMSNAWEHRTAAERGIRRHLRAFAPIHAIHLRMADVGSLAAARVAASLHIPMVFTAAPDPHAVIEGLYDAGTITRETFGDNDYVNHWWFRARMVENLTRSADAVALLPRPRVRRRVSAYFGIPEAELGPRAAVIPEGIHAATARLAHREAADFTGENGPLVLAELRGWLKALPPHRRNLPLLVSVGRLHLIKGMHRVVAAWIGADDLRDAYNLVIVGGDIINPSSDERAALAAIDALVPHRIAPERGLVLFGHRPHADTARILSYAARERGIYVCGSAKEEYGLAIVEALAAGLPPVAPREGGPSTYLDDGQSGILVDGSDVQSIRDGIRRARGIVGAPGRADAARARVERDMTIEQMALGLSRLYRRAGAPRQRVSEAAA